jgi:hypothetical protein
MSYTITDLDTLTHPMAVNDAGQVVGYRDVDVMNKIFQAFFWESGEMIYLKDPNWPTSIAFCVNNDRWVAGGAVSIPADPKGHAFYCASPLSKPPEMTDLQSENGLMTGIARGINDKRDIVGHQYQFVLLGQPPNRVKKGTENRAIFWPSGVGANAVLLNPLPDQYLGSKASAINEKGVIVGRANKDEVGNFVGCLWKTFEELPLRLDPPIRSVQSYAWAVNDNVSVDGLHWPGVVGIYGPGVVNGVNPVEVKLPPAKSPTRYACRWEPIPQKGGWKYAVKPLFPGLVNSFALDINNTEEMVGTFEDDSLPDSDPLMKQRAFYSASHWPKPLDLTGFIKDNPGWTLKVARGINNHGQIVGEGLFEGQPHGFLLYPSRIPAPHLP